MRQKYIFNSDWSPRLSFHKFYYCILLSKCIRWCMHAKEINECIIVNYALQKRKKNNFIYSHILAYAYLLSCSLSCISDRIAIFEFHVHYHVAQFESVTRKISTNSLQRKVCTMNLSNIGDILVRTETLSATTALTMSLCKLLARNDQGPFLNSK